MSQELFLNGLINHANAKYVADICKDGLDFFQDILNTDLKDSLKENHSEESTFNMKVNSITIDLCEQSISVVRKNGKLYQTAPINIRSSKILAFRNYHPELDKVSYSLNYKDFTFELNCEEIKNSAIYSEDNYDVFSDDFKYKFRHLFSDNTRDINFLKNFIFIKKDLLENWNSK